MKIVTLKKHFNSISLRTMTTFGLFIILQAHMCGYSGYQRPISGYQTAIKQINPQIYTDTIANRKNLSLTEGGGFFYEVITSGDQKKLDVLLERINKDFDTKKNEDYINNFPNSVIDPIYNDTALMKTIRIKNGKMAKALIENAHFKPSLTIADNQGATPLHLALQNNLTEIADLLVDKLSVDELSVDKLSAARLSQQNSQQKTPLHIAVELGLAEIVDKLLNQLTPKAAFLQDDKGFTPLHRAIKLGNGIAQGLIDKAKLIDKSEPSSLKLTDKKGRTPFHMAASYKTVSTFQQMWIQVCQEDLSQATSYLRIKDKTNKTVFAHAYLPQSKTVHLLNKYTGLGSTKKQDDMFLSILRIAFNEINADPDLRVELLDEIHRNFPAGDPTHKKSIQRNEKLKSIMSKVGLGIKVN